MTQETEENPISTLQTSFFPLLNIWQWPFDNCEVTRSKLFGHQKWLLLGGQSSTLRIIFGCQNIASFIFRKPRVLDLLKQVPCWVVGTQARGVIVFLRIYMCLKFAGLACDFDYVHWNRYAFTVFKICNCLLSFHLLGTELYHVFPQRVISVDLTKKWLIQDNKDYRIS